MSNETIAWIGIIQVPFTICAIIIWYRWKVKQSKKSWFTGRVTPEWDEAIIRGDSKDKKSININI